MDWQRVVEQLEREAGEVQNRANAKAVANDEVGAAVRDAEADMLRRIAGALKAGLTANPPNAPGSKT